MTHWLAWYEDRQYGSENSKITDLPEDGCLGFCVFYSDGRSICHSGPDYYFYVQDHDDIWSTYGSIGELKARYPNASHIMRGRWTSAERFSEVALDMEEVRTTPRAY